MCMQQIQELQREWPSARRERQKENREPRREEGWKWEHPLSDFGGTGRIDESPSNSKR